MKIIVWFIAALLLLIMLQSISYRWIRKQPEYEGAVQNGTKDATQAIAEGRDANSVKIRFKDCTFAYYVGYANGWYTTFARHKRDTQQKDNREM